MRNNPSEFISLPDMQKNRDERGIEIDRVGVSNVRYPLNLHLRDGDTFNTVANLSLSVSLPHAEKGTHMSRFMTFLNEKSQLLRLDTVHMALEELGHKMQSEEVFLDMEFPVFLKRHAPVTGLEGLLDFNCILRAMLTQEGQCDTLVGVRANVTSCCPCSREISRYGAHNQRSEVSISVRPKEYVWFEDLIDIAEKSASSQLYPILKRADEKNVTERAYENPKFVEDIVRDAAIELLELLKGDAIAWFYLSSNNYESIHNHDAFAEIERGTRGPLLERREARDVASSI
jgi:GTP cyclohydrolase I